MSRVRIVTDSTVRFVTPGFLDRYPITVAPLTLRCQMDAWEEVPGADLAQAHALFERCQGFPLAVPPSPERMAEIYGQLTLETDQIVSIHVTARLNPTVANAQAAAQQFLGRSSIQVIDSQSMAGGLGLLVEAAGRAAADGADIEDVVRIVRGMVPRLYLVVFVGDLTYLERGGLVSRSQAILGNMLGVLPFLTMEDGSLVVMEKVRSRPRAVEKVVEFVEEFSDLEHVVVFEGATPPSDEVRLIVERLRAQHPTVPITTGGIGPSVATYLGPSSAGIFALERENGAR